jgi:hydrogenase expression/formation protein HypC
MCLAIPGKVVELTTENPHLALVEVCGVRRQVNVDLVSDGEGSLANGDWVLIHVGFAMSKISQAAAEEQMRLLSMLGEDLEAMREIEGYDLEVGPGGRGREEAS